MILPGNDIDYHQYFFGIISKFIEAQGEVVYGYNYGNCEESGLDTVVHFL